MKMIFVLSLFIMSFKALAFDYPYLMRSPKGLLMGDAYTAVNDDSYSQFYNPATLARNKSDFHIYPFNPQLNGSNVLDDLEQFEDFPTEPVGASKVLMDYPVHASAGIAPGFQLFNVGVTFLASESYDLLLRNQAQPMLDVDLHSDKGILFGVGLPLGTGRISRKSPSGSQTSLGLQTKYLERTGIRDTLSLTGPTTLECLDQEDPDKISKCLGKVKGIGWGFDAGLEHIVKRGNSRFVIGLAALDITGTQFKEQKTPDNLQVSDIPNQVNLGLAAGTEVQDFHFKVSADIRALNQQMDFTKRVRLGAEAGLGGISLLGGVNSGYYSYGAMLDFRAIKISGGFYDVELGSKAKQIKSRRFVVFLSLFDFSFDS